MGATDDDVAKYKAALPTHLENLERLLGDQDYFCGTKLNVADLNIFDVLDVTKCQIPDVLDALPKLKAFFARVSTRPNIAKWIASEQRAKLFRFPPV